MTNNDKAPAPRLYGTSRAAETNSMTFAPADPPRRTGKVRSPRRSSARRIIR